MPDTDVDGNEEINVSTLLSQLRKEKLFITKEKYNIQDLNETVKTKIGDLIRSIWMISKQRFYLLAQREFSSRNFEHIHALANAEFVEAKNVLGFQTTVKLARLLQILRTQPEQLARWLFLCEQSDEPLPHLNLLLQSIVVGLYSSCIFLEDIKLVLKLLYELAKLQLVKSQNPRRMLKQGNCSFRTLYFMFHEVLPSAKFFLSAALEIPIIQLLAYREIYLDVDPEKSFMRYKQDEGNIRSDFKDIQEYRNEVITRLVEFVKNFTISLRDNIFNFPKSIAWIINQISKIITKSFGSKEANAVVTELIFTSYICPVIVDPEQHAICDSQITHIARHNLMQIGQILQIMALNKYESIDTKFMDIYNQLDKNDISGFIDDIIFHSDIVSVPVDDADDNTSSMVVRDVVLLSEQELSHLVTFLQKVHNDLIQNEHYKKSVIDEHIASLTLPSSLDNSPKSNRSYHTNGFSSSSHGSNGVKKLNFLNLVTKSNSSPKLSSDEHVPITVLSFSLEQDCISDPIGLLPEDKVLNMNAIKKVSSSHHQIVNDMQRQQDVVDTDNTNNDKSSSNYHHSSNYHQQDEGSIGGNISDNLEAISEAASNHSVASSLELEENEEDQNDNLSDMISANVSGRGSPNISGRDTPSSQVNENEERERPRQVDNNNITGQTRPQIISRQIRSEIDDKFCKFEIKKLLEGDETISIISETWSTDVLASDNETIDAGDLRMERQLIDQVINENMPANILDISETQSESAWSTDVMASSDTERLTEVDNDDAGSVAAQSDDTNSVARSDDTRSETDENLMNPPPAPASVPVTTRRLSNSSPNNHHHQEYRKLELLKNEQISFKIQQQSGGGVSMSHRDNNANNLFKSSVSSVNSVVTEIKNNSTTIYNNISNHHHHHHHHRIVTNNHHQVLLSNNKDMAGPSGFLNNNNKRHSGSNNCDSGNTNVVVSNSNGSGSNNYNETTNEILLSNCSLNSSSSSGSSNSSNSFENKTTNEQCEREWENKQWLNSSGSSLNVTSTPSESTSELSSVLSVNNLNNNQTNNNHNGLLLLNNNNNNIINNGNNNNNNNKLITTTTSTTSAVLLGRNLKPSASTGAIPKSISFDMSADKGDKYFDDNERNKRGGFFGKLRMGFRNRRGKSLRNQDDFRFVSDCGDGGDYSLSLGKNTKIQSDASPVKFNNNSESEDILAKYRTKPFIDSSSSVTIRENLSKSSTITSANEINNIAIVDNLDVNNSFVDIKKKLRLVLSDTTMQIPSVIKATSLPIKSKIETILRLELGKARTLKTCSNIARISEAIRCVNLLNETTCVALLESMKNDILQRSVYTQYLICSRQELLLCESYLDGLKEQICNESQQCKEYLSIICVREFLIEHEAKVVQFCDEFKELSLSDEKNDYLNNFYQELYLIMENSGLWQVIFKNISSTIKITLERCIMSKVYMNALYPNGDGDRDRDHVLYQHIEKLSRIISPDHKDLLIHKMFLREFPWTPAQDALKAIGAYKTARDKLKCIIDCAKCIMDLLSFSQHSGSTTADDFTPVLVYVIIRVNPNDLLSTIQFVNSFYQNQICGEEHYWWTQFCAAVEYIKTMDYSD